MVHNRVICAGGFSALLCLLLVGIHTVGAADVDSLLLRLPTVHDTAKVNIYNQLYWATIYHDRDQAFSYTQTGIKLAKENGYTKGEHGLLICKAHFHSLNRQIEREIELKLAALHLAENLGYFEQALSYYTLGEAYRNYKDVALAFEYLNKALELTEQIDNKWIEAKTLGELGALWQGRGDTLRAINHMQRSIHLLESIDATQSSSWMHNRLADLYRMQQDWELSIKQYKKAAAQFSLHNNQTGIYLCYSGLGIVARERGNYAKSIRYFQQGLKQYEEDEERQRDLPKTLYNLAATYLDWEKPNKAKTNIDACIRLISALPEHQLASEIYTLQGQIYLALGDTGTAYQAVHKGYLSAKESYKNLHQREIENLELVYRADRRDRVNALMKQEMLLEKNEKRSIFLIAGILLTLMTGVLVGSAYLSKKKLSQALMESNQKISHQKEALEEANQKLAEQNEKLATINEEKENTIRIVTHDLKAPLDRISGLVSLFRDNRQERSEQEQLYLDKIQHVINEGSQTISRLLDIWALGEKKVIPKANPVKLSEQLNETVSKFYQLATRKNINIEVQVKEDILIHTDRFYLDRILENLLSNAVKYSFPDGNIWVRGGKCENCIYIEVEDEGPGIPVGEQEKLYKNFQRLSSRPTGGESSTGLGLALSQNIATKLGGKISFRNAIKHGAIFRLTLPLQKEPLT